jgi:hypothetical protein
VLSVSFCNSYLTSFNGAMIEFYFRNGPLRRKFDGLKYACKTVESVIYDLSLIPTTADDLLSGFGECYDFHVASTLSKPSI